VLFFGYYVFAGIPPIALGFFLGFAAGTFLFISALHSFRLSLQDDIPTF